MSCHWQVCSVQRQVAFFYYQPGMTFDLDLQSQINQGQGPPTYPSTKKSRS